MKWQTRIAVLYPLLSGAIFVALGLLTLAQPDVFEYYAIGIDSASARTAIRAMIGGGEVGLGILMFGGGRLGFSVGHRCTIAATIFACVGLARLLSAALEGNQLLGSHQPFREAWVELMLGCLGVLAAIIARRADLSRGSEGKS
ncbi:DUF4345 family protein [Qipengyuania sp. S6317L1]|uniref:DUF4345 family protein n=1 Tax=Qipengyuania sp. S6317L1 TaxID=2926410 RepID=UPI001FF3C583|nr:DUF4345 family protein [Qipengyuania sp. S6317L1]